MHWSAHPPYLFLVFLSEPDPPGPGFPFEPPISADWANAIIALCSMYIAWRTFRFSIKTYDQQQEQNRTQEAQQRQKDREAAQQQSDREQAARLELERVRQRTSRLEWYRYVVRPELKDAHEAFGRLHELKNRIRNSDLTDPEKTQLSTDYDQIVADLRNKLLERVLYIHKPTYDKLKGELDKMLGLINKALFDDDLKLNKDRTYEQWIGGIIRTCQQCFFEILYDYQGEETVPSVEPESASNSD